MSSPKIAPPSLLPLHRAYYFFSKISLSEALNDYTDEAVENSENLVFALRKMMNTLKQEAFADDGSVNYHHLKDSPSYTAYRQMTGSLRTFPLASLTGNAERMAFWINLYNVLIIDAIIHYQIEKTVQEVKGFFARAAYIIDGQRFSADDIEHGILRANAGHIAIPGPQFGRHDKRRQFILPSLDPRLHFALVCGAQSCPPVGVYHPDRLEAQLHLAAHNFINSSEVTVDLSAYTVQLSRIFQWYAPDFGGVFINQVGLGKFNAVLRYIAHFVEDTSTQDALLNIPERFKVAFHPYNWGLNLMTASSIFGVV